MRQLASAFCLIAAFTTACDTHRAAPARYVVLSVTDEETVRLETANFDADEIRTCQHVDGMGLTLGSANGVLVEIEATLTPGDDRARVDLSIDTRVPLLFAVDDFEDAAISIGGRPEEPMVQIEPGRHDVVVQGRPSPRDSDSE